MTCAVLLLAQRTSLEGETETEPVVVVLTDDGRLVLTLDDGDVINLSWDDVLAVADARSAALEREVAA